jgi:hypothetical protein
MVERADAPPVDDTPYRNSPALVTDLARPAIARRQAYLPRFKRQPTPGQADTSGNPWAAPPRDWPSCPQPFPMTCRPTPSHTTYHAYQPLPDDKPNPNPSIPPTRLAVTLRHQPLDNPFTAPTSHPGDKPCPPEPQDTLDLTRPADVPCLFQPTDEPGLPESVPTKPCQPTGTTSKVQAMPSDCPSPSS